MSCLAVLSEAVKLELPSRLQAGRQLQFDGLTQDCQAGHLGRYKMSALRAFSEPSRPRLHAIKPLGHALGIKPGSPTSAANWHGVKHIRLRTGRRVKRPANRSAVQK